MVSIIIINFIHLGELIINLITIIINLIHLGIDVIIILDIRCVTIMYELRNYKTIQLLMIVTTKQHVNRPWQGWTNKRKTVFVIKYAFKVTTFSVTEL